MINLEAVQVVKLMMREAELAAERDRLVVEAKRGRAGGFRRAAGAGLVRLGLWLMGPATAWPVRREGA